MDLVFYKYAATPERVDKTNFLTEMGTLSGVELKAETNLMRPKFILRTNPVVYNSNYVYCSFTGRYYYIHTVTAMSGGRIAIDCSIDVLHTYRNEIKGSSGWVMMSASTSDTSDDYNMLHNDYPFRADKEVKGVDFISVNANPFSNVSEPNIFFVIK